MNDTTQLGQADVLGRADEPSASGTCPPWTIDPTVLFGIGLLGTVMALLLWMAPIRDVWVASDSVYVSKTTKRVATAFPYVSALFNCILWIMYYTSNIQNFMVPTFLNVAGILLNASFMWCYWRYASPDDSWRVQMYFLAFTLVTGVAVVLWVLVDVEAVGYVASVVNSLMLFAPLMAAKQVVRSKSTQGMPFPPLILTLFTGVTWFAYGVYLCNVQCMIPNALGIVFGIVQIGLWSWARWHERRARLVAPDFDTLDSPNAPPIGVVGLGFDVRRPHRGSWGGSIGSDGDGGLGVAAKGV